MNKSYQRAAEFYDLLSEEHWERRIPLIKSILSSVTNKSPLIVDIGAGTGAALKIVSQVLPKAIYIAYEPSLCMRVGLMNRLLLNPELRKKVTVCPASVATAHFPEQIDLVLVFGCLGHFSEEERHKLWQVLSQRLTHDGFALIDLMPINQPLSVPKSQIVNSNVGQNHYEIFMSGEPINESTMNWTMTYQVTSPFFETEIFSDNYQWQTFGLDKVKKEIKDFGLAMSVIGNSPIPMAKLFNSVNMR